MSHRRIRINPMDFTQPGTSQRYLIYCFVKTVQVIVTSSHQVVDKWIEDINCNFIDYIEANRLTVGLGVFCQPNSQQASVISLCVGPHCLIFQLHHTPSLPDSLVEFLNEYNHHFVGFNNSRDLVMLKAVSPQLCVRLLDVARLSTNDPKFRGSLQKNSITELAEFYLGWPDIVKQPDIGRSDWDVERLSQDQVQYAAIDAFLSFKVGVEMRIWNSNK